MKIRCGIATLLLVTTPLWFGCEAKPVPSGGSGSKSVTSGHSHEGHSHEGHDHGHGDEHGHDHPEHGPNGGHIVHFDTSPTTHFEWAHDDETQTLTVYFEELVNAGAKIESVEIRVTSEGSEKKFTLLPDEQAKVAGSVYQLKDQELLTLVGASGDDPKGVQAKMFVTIDGKEESLLLKDDHHHH
ncbi:MAG: hypothetical protein MUF23_02885 [Pirellula sp.]|jgi:hypothetical protein|nr:hypothetical protein [Pirellula sp.]